jgi:hypothetical protein
VLGINRTHAELLQVEVGKSVIVATHRVYSQAAFPITKYLVNLVEPIQFLGGAGTDESRRALAVMRQSDADILVLELPEKGA